MISIATFYMAKEFFMSTRGLDVSEFQGTVDWEQVKAAGYQFAMLRAGYGFGTLDQQFQRNAAECTGSGSLSAYTGSAMPSALRRPVRRLTAV